MGEEWIYKMKKASFYLLCISVFLLVGVCTMCKPHAHRCQKSLSNLLKL